MGKRLKTGRKNRADVLFYTLVTALMCTIATPCWALKPREVLVVANTNVPAGMRLAGYYMKKRAIPDNNLVSLTVSHEENIRGQAFEKDLIAPLKTFLKDKDPFMLIRCIVLMYGIPLKVNRPQLPETRAELNALTKQRAALKDQLDGLEKGEARTRLQQDVKKIKNKITALQRMTRSASVDSEVALILETGYDTAGWIPNPLFLGNRGKRFPGMPGHALMVSRLDGPTETMVQRMIDDSLAAEEKGLQGKAYFDARWPEPEEKKKSGYGFYDQSIHRAANLLKKKRTVPVVLDDRHTLFQQGDCPQAALYCGWYSLKKYVDAFDWQPGSVGYHIASGECITLKKPDSRVWCKAMIEDGIAATLGPVSEPYVEAFPPPEVFFGLLVEGRYTLAECYAASLPFLSWKMVLIGDPLYRPFKTMEAR